MFSSETWLMISFFHWTFCSKCFMLRGNTYIVQIKNFHFDWINFLAFYWFFRNFQVIHIYLVDTSGRDSTSAENFLSWQCLVAVLFAKY